VVREDSRDEVSEPAAVACAICPGMKRVQRTRDGGAYLDLDLLDLGGEFQDLVLDLANLQCGGY
jgi:hypothetical protein